MNGKAEIRLFTYPFDQDIRPELLTERAPHPCVRITSLAVPIVLVTFPQYIYTHISTIETLFPDAKYVTECTPMTQACSTTLDQ